MAESVFDRTVNADGSTGVWWRHTFDIAGQNAANDWVDPADPRQVFQSDWPNLPDGIVDGNNRSLGLLRCRQAARTWRPSGSALSLITVSLSDDVEPDIRVAVRLVGDDDFIALRLGMDTDAPYTNMVVDFASDALSGADIAARYETWLARAASSTAQITVALIDSTHSEFQSASYDFDDGVGSQAATAAPSIEVDLSVSATATLGGGAQAATAAPSIEVDLSVCRGNSHGGRSAASISARSDRVAQSIEVDLSLFRQRPQSKTRNTKAAGEDLAVELGASFNAVLQAGSGGTAPYTYAVTNLPPGVTFTAAGRLIAGAPTQAGAWMATYTITDDNGVETVDRFLLMAHEPGQPRYALLVDWDGDKSFSATRSATRSAI